MKMSYKGFIYEAVSITDTPAFRAWFGDSKVVDEDGEPLNVYHGTTKDFDTFNIRKFYKDAYVGGGFYFTSSTVDADVNYAGNGPDNQGKISTRVDEINDLDRGEIAEILGISEDEMDEMDEDALGELILKEAESEILGDNPAPNIMPVYLKIVNPFYIGKEFRQYFEFNEPYDEETDSYGEPEGFGVELLDALRETLLDVEYIDSDEAYTQIMHKCLEDGGEFSSNVFFNAIKECDLLVDGMYGEDNAGYPVVFKHTILAAGFDGVIMDASVFSSMKGTQGANHYIVYKPNQIKSVFNKNPTSDNNITKE